MRMTRKPPATSVWHWLAIVSMVIFVVSAALYWGLSDPPPRFDADTLCPKEGSPVGVTAINVILIDRTERITNVQAKDVALSLAEIVAASMPQEKFILYEIVGASKLDPSRRTILCNPGGSEKKSIGDWFTYTPVSKKIFEERFIGRINAIVRDWLQINNAPDSPIMELIQAVVVQDLKHAPVAIPKRMIIVSDMMQNSKGFSQIRGFNEITFFASPFFQKTRTDLSNIDVRVIYLTRVDGASKQPSGHQAFWQKYFEVLGRKSLVMQPV